MYAHDSRQISFSEFLHPFGEGLNPENRWIKLAELIPWREAEQYYAKRFSSNGPSAYPVRMALGALILKEKLGVPDRELVEQIRENPYLQFFLGLHEFQHKAPFDDTLLPHFRKRFDIEFLGQLNLKIVENAQQIKRGKDSDDDSPPPPDGGTFIETDQPTDPESKTSSSSTPPSHQGRMIIDATVSPADIRFPTDLNLINEAREKSDQIIDILHVPDQGHKRHPRTYRQVARKCYLNVAKKKQASKKAIRTAIGQQLRFLKRNLGIIDTYIVQNPSCLETLPRWLYQRLLVISEVYRQQYQMYSKRECRIEDRIVSLQQPHVRPIVRGKANAKVEFGAKLLVSECDGMVVLDQLSWDNFNESTLLIEKIEAFKKRFGHWPTSVHADRIFRTRENRRFCKDKGIRLSGPALGRPVKITEENKAKQKALKKVQQEDERIRNRIEGRFGQGKRRFGLGRIMAKLRQTSECTIGIIMILINLETCLQAVFFYFSQNLLGARRRFRLTESAKMRRICKKIFSTSQIVKTKQETHELNDLALSSA